MNLHRVVGNSLSSGMVPLVKIIITFIMAPLIVHALGDYDYGIWEIIFAVVGYMGILDLGLMPAIVRYVARHHAIGDKVSLDRIYSSAMAFLFVVGLICALGIICVAFFAPNLIMQGGNGAGGHKKYTIFLFIVAAQTFVTFTGSLFDCFLEGLQKYTLRNFTTVVMSILGAVVLYPLLKNGGGLLSVAVVNACGFAIKFVFFGIILSTNFYGRFRFRFADTSFATLRDMFSFGFKSLAYAISLRISTLTDSLVVGAFLGPATVTHYIIPYNLVAMTRTFIWALSRNFMPLFSELDAKGQNESARTIYLWASRFLVGVILPLMIGIVMLGPSFLEYWMGPEYASSGKWVLYIIAGAFTVQWINPFANRLLTGYGRHGIMAVYGIVGSIINLIASLLLVQFIGKEGVALGTLLSVMIFEPLLLFNTCSVLGITIFVYLRNVIIPLFIPASTMVTVFLYALIYHHPSSLFHVMLIATVGVMFYLPCFIFCSLTSEERSSILQKINF